MTPGHAGLSRWAAYAVVGLGALSRVYDGSTNAPLSGVAGVTPPTPRP